MDNGTVIILGIVVAAGIFTLAFLIVQSETSSNLCAAANANKFPFGATCREVLREYGHPKAKYEKEKITYWIYSYPQAFIAGRCKIAVIFREGKAVDYKREITSEPLFEELK